MDGGSFFVRGHRAFIYDRGGMLRIGALVKPTMVQWSRVRDGVSEAKVVIAANRLSMQRELLESLRAHRHELVIYRGRDRVWEGPLHRLTWRNDGVEIVAHDIFAYLLATPLTRTWSNAGAAVGTVTDRIRRIIQYELTTSRQQYADGVLRTVPAWEALSPPANILPHLDIRNFVNEAETSMVTHPFTQTVGDHILQLARYSGVDFTVIGRRFVAWDVSRALGRTVQLSDESFIGEVIVTEYGADHAQSAYVVGMAPDEGAPPVGSGLRWDNLDYYGPWTEIFTPYNEEGTREPTQGELNSQAIRNLSGRTPAPVEVRVPDQSQIVLTNSLRIEHLVPGVQMPLRATLAAREYSQMQKLDTVRVTEDADGERIQVTLVPTTKPDADEELPEPERRVSTPFPGDNDYVLRATATAAGTSYQVKVTVEHTGDRGDGVNREDMSWSVTGQRAAGTNITKAGQWSAKYRYADLYSVARVQVDNAATGFRDFSVTVDMGAGIGIASVGGTVEVK